MNAPLVSVIVPMYEAERWVPGCLGALDAQSLTPSQYEVIVVDDGSDDGTAEAARAFATTARATFTVVEQAENAGPAAARNAGLRVARGEIVAFTDADCVVAPDWLEKGVARARDASIAGVEGRTDPAGETGTLTHQMRNETGGHWMTCNMFYRRAALDEAGGFDERFRAAFLEDSDVAFSVLERGGRIAWDPDVIVKHLVLDEGRAKFVNEARKRCFNPLLYRKHPDLYVEHIATVVPGLPPLHLRYMLALVTAVVSGALTAWPVFVPAALLTALFLRRVAHAYRARDVVSVLQAAVHPFVQTYWVLRGAVRFRTFSLDI